jgi:hypothetical protein
MYFHPPNFSLPLLAGTLIAAALSVEAQQPATNAGRSIVFSSSDKARVSSNSTPSSTKSSPPKFRDRFQAASPFSTFNTLPSAPPPVLSEERQLPKRLDRRKDWVFMTPAEILGVATPEKILGIQERDAAGQPKNPTLIERYNERQRIKTSGTNDWSFYKNPAPFRNSSGDRNNRTNTSSFNPTDNGLENLRSTIFSRLNATPDDDLFAGQNADSDRSKLSGSPASNPAQQADMAQFRQLLEPGFSPATAATLSPDRTAFSHPLASPASGAVQPLVNPFGASFAPLSNGIGRPAGLQPLPGVTRQTSTQPAITPPWAPQPPPWLSQTPQPFVIPQRKF